VLINYHSLLADRSRGVRELYQILSDLFGNSSKLMQHRASVLVGISQAPTKSTETDEPLELRDISGELLHSEGLPFEKVLNSLASQVFVFHPLGKGDDTWLKRDAIIERIRKLTPITDAGSIFSTVLMPEDEQALRYDARYRTCGEQANQVFEFLLMGPLKSCVRLAARSSRS
jgi:hypothetical protein